MKTLRKITRAVGMFIRQTDRLLIILCTLAASYGFLLVYSATTSAGGGFSDCLMQLVCIALGIVAALVISRLDYEFIASLWPFLAGVSVLLVLLTFTSLGYSVPGTDDQNWLEIPLGPKTFLFQPSELLKIAFIITFSFHLSRVREHINRPLTVLLLCAHGLFPALLVFAQGDDGTAAIFLCIFMGMMFAAGLKPLYFLIGFAGVLGLVPVLWSRLDENKKARFLSIVFVDQYVESTGWQQQLGLTAMGSGQLWGVGYLKGGGHQLYARNNDFIFTVAGEEFGFVGSLILIALLVLIVLAIFRNAMAAKNRLGMFICVGMMSLIGFQSVINIGMTVRLLPVLGITLPFFSSGGSSVLTLFLGIGLVLSVHHFSHAGKRETIFTKRS